MRKAAIKIEDQLAGWLTQDEQGYHFVYDHAYAAQPGVRPVSLTLPLREAPYTSNVLFPFFDGLIPEGWLLDIAERNWKLNPRDRMGLLLACCKDCICAVSVMEIKNQEPENRKTGIHPDWQNCGTKLQIRIGIPARNIPKSHAYILQPCN